MTILGPVDRSPWRPAGQRAISLSRADDPDEPDAIELMIAHEDELALAASVLGYDTGEDDMQYPYDDQGTGLFSEDTHSPAERADAYETWRSNPESSVWRNQGHNTIPDSARRSAPAAGIDHRTIDEFGQFRVPTRQDVLSNGGTRIPPASSDDHWALSQVDAMARTEATDDLDAREFSRTFRQGRF